MLQNWQNFNYDYKSENDYKCMITNHYKKVNADKFNFWQYEE